MIRRKEDVPMIGIGNVRFSWELGQEILTTSVAIAKVSEEDFLLRS